MAEVPGPLGTVITMPHGLPKNTNDDVSILDNPLGLTEGRQGSLSLLCMNTFPYF